MLFQECDDDKHNGAVELRKKRVRSYIFRRTITPDCRAETTFILECYLIIDNATVSDAGEYTFTASIFGGDPTKLQRNLNIVVGMFISTAIMAFSHNSSHFSFV